MRKFEILKVVFLLLGTVIGAGFASGKEIYMFFGDFDFPTCINIIICGIAFFMVTYMFLNCKKKTDFQYFQNSKIGISFDVLMLFFMFVSVSALTAALSTAFGKIVSIASLVLTLIIVFRGIGWLKNVNLILVPIIIVVLFVISLLSVKGKMDLNVNNAFLMNSFLYVGMNIFLASEVLVDVGGSLNKKEKLVSSIISAVIFALILIVITIGFSYNNITSSIEMPTLHLVKKLPSAFLLIYLFVLWAGVFTTLISVVYSMKAKVKKIFNANSFSIVVLCALAFLFSLFGFQKITTIFYPVEGVAGIVYSLVVFILIFASEGRGVEKNKSCT